MEKDVLVNDTVYSGVANVVLTDADDGDSTIFNETSGATADDDDVSAGETYYANGEERTGTHECQNINDDNLHIPWENVDNKPFYEEVVDNIISWNGIISDKDNITVQFSDISVTFYKVSDNYISKEDIINSTVVCNESNISIIASDIILTNTTGSYVANIYVAVASSDNEVVTGNIGPIENNIIFPSKGIYLSKFITNDNITIITSSLSIKVTEVKKHLDSKFISDDIMRTSEKGTSGGVATLGDDGKIPISQLPSIMTEGGSIAKNIFFENDLITTTQIGNISLTDGKAIIPAKDKNLIDVWDYIFKQDKNPTIIQPYITLTTPNNKTYEVGTTVTPEFTINFNEGSYEYDASTNVNVTSVEVVNSLMNEYIYDTSGEFNSITVDDDTNYTIYAIVEHSDGIVPSTVLGNKYYDGQIKSGYKVQESQAITGYRNSFYGTVTSKNDINSDVIRSLTASGKALSNGSSFSITIPIGAVRVIIAYPATLQDISSIKDVNAMNAEILSAFNVQNIEVEDAGGSNPISYKVYVLDYGILNDTKNIYKVII